MIPENTKENKAAFFALYWGQDVVKSGNPADPRTYNVEGANIEDECYNSRRLVIEDAYLALTPLSQISDEDAIEVAKIFKYDKNFDAVEITKDWCLAILENKRNYFSNYHQNYITAYDFLRSRGYALPWRGLSVHELIQRGWMKLKEEVEK